MKRQKRAVVLNHFAVPRDQPGGTRHVELFERLTDWDYVIVAADRNPSTGQRQPRTPRFRFVRVPAHSSNGLARILSWVAYAVQAFFVALWQRPDVVYASSPHLLAGLAGWCVARLSGVPFVLEIRDLWPQVLVDMNHLDEGSRQFKLLTSLELFLYRHADHLVSMAPGTTASLQERGAEQARITYLPNAADPADFTSTDDRERARADRGFSRFTAVYAGAHGPANGLDLVLAAAAQVRGLEIDIVLVGDGLEKPRLVAQASSLELENVRFLAPIAKTDIPNLLHASDIGLHVLADVPLFRSSVSPNKVFDYFAAELPVLTNCPGVVSDMVRGAGAGVTVDPTELASGLAAMALMSDEERVRCGRNGRAWLEANFTRTTVAARLDELLATVASRPTPVLHLPFKGRVK